VYKRKEENMTRMARLITIASFFWSALLAFALPTWLQDEYLPDLITAVNQDSSGGHYYLRSSAPIGKDSSSYLGL
jgi:hypothetical protein